jgi:GNAT superfamily N-acetyltransferase
MDFIVTKVPLKDLGDLRSEFLAEIDIQFIYDKCHLYGWADTYLFTTNGSPVGYGSVWGKEEREDRDSIFEYYFKPGFRRHSHDLFQKFIDTSGVAFIECQSNDPFLSEVFFEFATDIYVENILFEDDFDSSLSIDGVQIQASPASGVNSTPGASDNRFDKPFVLKLDGKIVASGGLMLNYNFPYADIYYGVEEEHRRKGYGSFFVQELKKEAYRMGRVPAARTGVGNIISKHTMMKAGLKPCGWRLGGNVRKNS